MADRNSLYRQGPVALLILCSVLGAGSLQQSSAQSISWTGGGDGASWSDAQNWSPARLPLASDDVAITQSGSYTVSLSAAVTVNSLTVGGASGAQTFMNAGFPVTVSSSVVVEPAGTVLWVGGNLSAAAITNRGTVQMTGATNKGIVNATFVNEGLLVYDQGDLFLVTGAEIDNRGTFDFSADVFLRRRAA